MLKKILIFAVFSLFAQFICKILRLPCKFDADFSAINPDTYLQSNFLALHEDVVVTECIKLCILETTCKSFSYNKVESKCALFDAVLEDVGAENVERLGWIHYQTEANKTKVGEVCQKFDPCPSLYCEDVCELPGFRCNCASGECNIGHNRENETFIQAPSRVELLIEYEVGINLVDSIVNNSIECIQRMHVTSALVSNNGPWFISRNEEKIYLTDERCMDCRKLLTNNNSTKVANVSISDRDLLPLRGVSVGDVDDNPEYFIVRFDKLKCTQSITFP